MMTENLRWQIQFPAAAATALLALVLLLLTGCDQQPTAAGTQAADTDTAVSESVAPDSRASVINYMEQESGVEPYPLRIIITENYIRLDDGYDDSDFVLLDRGPRTLYSVTHENRSVLVINNQPAEDALPESIELTEKVVEDTESPEIAGRPAVHKQYLANDQLCFEAVTVDGLLPEAVEAMAEFATALGERQLANMHTMPAAMQTPCFLSRYVYRTDRHYDDGLPIQEWDATGNVRSMVDYSEDETINPSIFNVPSDYVGMSL